jgi:hypothetical protein
MSHLRDALVRVILGDVDGFLDTLTGMQPFPSRWETVTAEPDQRVTFVEPRRQPKTPMIGPMPA